MPGSLGFVRHPLCSAEGLWLVMFRTILNITLLFKKFLKRGKDVRAVGMNGHKIRLIIEQIHVFPSGGGMSGDC